MTALHRPHGASSRKGMEKVIHDYYSDLFDSHVHLPHNHPRDDGYEVPKVLPSEVRHAITSAKNRTAPIRCLLERKVPKQWRTSKTVLLYKKGDLPDIGNYRPSYLLSVVYKLFTRVILSRIERTLDEEQPCEQAGFRRRFSTIDHIHAVSKLSEVSREYKMPLCLTFIDLKKGFYSLETEAVMEALDN